MSRRRTHAKIHLPPLTAEQAWLLVKLFERAAAAVWRAHGDAMADFTGPLDEPREPNDIDADHIR
jgi:hypothetical protein